MKRIDVTGYIVPDEDVMIYSWFGYPVVSPQTIKDDLVEADGDDVELVINCYGGDVWAANSIYSELKKYSGKTKASITGLCASAATILLCGCDEAEAWPAAQIMVHLSNTYRSGNYHDMEEGAESLKVSDAGLVAVYTERTGQPAEAMRELIERTSWLAPDEALELGLIDSIVDPAEKKALPVAASGIQMPDIGKLRAAYTVAQARDEPEEESSPEPWQERASARLQIERIRYS